MKIKAFNNIGFKLLAVVLAISLWLFVTYNNQQEMVIDTPDESISKTVPVKVSVVGTPKKGYKIKAIEVNPPYIKIDGAKTEVNKVIALKTEQINIAGLDKDITQNVRLDIGDKSIKTEISEVAVRVMVERIEK